MDTLIRKRANIKGSLTRFINYVNSYTSENGSEALESRLQCVEGLIKRFEEVQDEIERIEIENSMLDDTVQENNERESTEQREQELFEQHSIERQNFEDMFYHSIGKAKKLLRSEGNIASSVQQASVNSHASGCGVTSVGLHLPKINLPAFDGTIGNWLKFRDTFLSMIHNDQRLTNMQRFHYLNDAVKGDAAQTIASLGISEANYNVAWQALTERYEDSNALLFCHAQALIDLNPITRESHQDLRTLIADVKNHLRSLKSLGERTEEWDLITICILAKKLNAPAKSEWEKYCIRNSGKPTLDGLLKVMENRCKLLEKMGQNSSFPAKERAKGTKWPETRANSKAFVTVSSKATCPNCDGNHPMYSCDKFKDLSIPARIERARSLSLCFNCLSSGHRNKNCSFGPCRNCGKKHNSLLHLETTRSYKTSNNTSNDSANIGLKEMQCSAVHFNGQNTYTLMPTAQIYIRDKYGNNQECRVLLDSGAQPNIMTKSLCNRLGLMKNRSNTALTGIEQGSVNVSYCATTKICSRVNNYSATLSFIVLNQISKELPGKCVKAAHIAIPKGVEMADPEFDCEGPIDAIIGSSIFLKLISVGQIFIKNSNLVLQKTLLGWIIGGDLFLPQKPVLSCHFVTNKTLNDELEKFWIVENSFSETISGKNKVDHCEMHFLNTATRDSNGRFIVSIPFKDNLVNLGESRQLAMKRLISTERRLSKNPELKREYHNFMREYELLGHMSEIMLEDNPEKLCFYLPHHAVIKEDSTTTKLRVVFDGSAKSSSGLSLNDVQYVGPAVQEDLFSIVLRFRRHNYVLTADIAKMYRQIQVKESQRAFQRILWRENTDDPIKTYELNTVTYGTASASFLATRCLKELSANVQKENPVLKGIISKDFYMDDLLTGAEDLKTIKRLKTGLSSILNPAGFELRKWASNSPDVFVHSTNEEEKAITASIETETKTLGVYWNPKDDTFKYRVRVDLATRTTKKAITSAIAQIFDPLGLVGHAIIRAKILLQQLWNLELDWDESVPQEIYTSWQRIQVSLTNINNLKIGRQVVPQNTKRTEYHGFCDASEAAYGACIYVCSSNASGSRSVSLLCAKSRVAPLKSTTLPRLELLGALLLAQLAHKVSCAYEIKSEQWFFWTDSMMALAWIRSSSNKWKTFVANRVSEIQELTNDNWAHVLSNFNPADLISRGCDAPTLLASKFWWSGPDWLSEEKCNWPTSCKRLSPNQEQEVLCLNINEVAERENERLTPSFDLLHKYSSLQKLKRITAYILRFIKGFVMAVKNNTRPNKNDKHLDKLPSIVLTVSETEHALILLVKTAQQETFAKEIAQLKGRNMVNNSRLQQLNPFLDESGLLRVGGRLRNANQLDYNQKHPILLDSNHHLTQLIIKNEHEVLLHAGCQTVTASLRTRFWPISAKSAIKGVIRKCLTCFKAKPIVTAYSMGDLPSSRLQPARAFSTCGVDYAGPFLIKEKTRSKTVTKGYICIFVCFATKAVHIELASDLSTDGFLNFFKRFVARRGICNKIYSDNGKNFIGASNELAKLCEMISKLKPYEALHRESIEWKFIPPCAPHFGGLWESAVKSAKQHLRRVVGETRLTYEELYTVLAQIEACLNSRPLSPLSNDPHDLTPLTPGHFLIGDSLMALPERNITHLKCNNLNRYQHLQQMFQHFWKRWQIEYLHQLQHRRKQFQGQGVPVKKGDLVIIKDDQAPPMQWPLGRIADVHPGKDGIIRVVTVKTSRGTLKRAVAKICVLPIENDD